MSLSRREVIAALLAGGATGTAVSALPSGLVETETAERQGDLTGANLEQLVAIAEVVFPSAIDVTAEDVSEYATRVPDDQRSAFHRTLTQLNRRVFGSHGRLLAEMSVQQRGAALRSMGIARVGSSPSGSLAERVRYYLINQLVYSLFTTPQGSELIGVENPVGYPGGYESYQRPPTDE